MAEFAEALGASKAASTLLVLFIPSKDRDDGPIDQDHWVQEALRALGTLFGGATAFPQGKGVWRDDAQGGKLLFDEPVVIQCYTSEKALEETAPQLREFLHRMGREAHQGAVGLVIDRDYLEIGFPLVEPAAPRGKRKKRRLAEMARNIETIADKLGAKAVAKVPDAGGGALGAARLARAVEELRTRLAPGRGKRAGRPTDARWVRHPKVPMSEATRQRLTRLAEEASTEGRKISPMQLAAQILEEALSGVPER